jgi:hypothetical protein
MQKLGSFGRKSTPIYQIQPPSRLIFLALRMAGPGRKRLFKTHKPISELCQICANLAGV